MTCSTESLTFNKRSLNHQAVETGNLALPGLRLFVALNELPPTLGTSW